MQQIITQGVVLNAFDYRDADKIVTIVTPEYGRLSAVLRGVKKVTAKMKFASQPFCYAQFKLVGGWDMLTVAGATEIESFFDITQDYRSMVAGSAILEMADAVSVVQQPDHLLFTGLTSALRTLANSDTDPDVILMRFALGVFKITGYALNLKNCKSCEKPLANDLVRFEVGTGELSCIHCSENDFIPVSARSLEIMQNMVKLQFDELEKIVLTEVEINEFRQIIRANFKLRYNRDLKSFNSLLEIE
ncbi:MAG: DNA repair protein RecO [Clostridia bacterium]|nr:DNA repair protein RecO [Clostridia bacterium]